MTKTLSASTRLSSSAAGCQPSCRSNGVTCSSCNWTEATVGIVADNARTPSTSHSGGLKVDCTSTMSKTCRMAVSGALAKVRSIPLLVADDALDQHPALHH
ncbi:hypothetical protein D3C80_1720930 [compost metagenome]